MQLINIKPRKKENVRVLTVVKKKKKTASNIDLAKSEI